MQPRSRLRFIVLALWVSWVATGCAVRYAPPPHPGLAAVPGLPDLPAPTVDGGLEVRQSTDAALKQASGKTLAIIRPQMVSVAMTFDTQAQTDAVEGPGEGTPGASGASPDEDALERPSGPSVGVSQGGAEAHSGEDSSSSSMDDGMPGSTDGEGGLSSSVAAAVSVLERLTVAPDETLDWIALYTDNLLFNLLSRRARVIDLTPLESLRASSTKTLRDGGPSEIQGALHEVAQFGRVAGARYVLSGKAIVTSSAGSRGLRLELSRFTAQGVLRPLMRDAARCETLASELEAVKGQYQETVGQGLAEYDTMTAAGVNAFLRPLAELQTGPAPEVAKRTTSAQGLAADRRIQAARDRAMALRAFAAALERLALDGDGIHTRKVLEDALFEGQEALEGQAESLTDYARLREQLLEAVDRSVAHQKYVGLDLKLIDADSSRVAGMARIRLLTDAPDQAAEVLAEAVARLVAPTRDERRQEKNRSRRGRN